MSYAPSLVVALLAACASHAPEPTTPSTNAAPPSRSAPSIPAWVTDPPRLTSELRAWYARAGDADCSRVEDPTVPVYVMVRAITPEVVEALDALGVTHDPEMGTPWELTGRLDRDAITAVLDLDFVEAIGAIHCSRLYGHSRSHR